MNKKRQTKTIAPKNKQSPIVKPIDPKHLQEQEELFKESDRISPVSKKIDKAEIVTVTTIGGEVINIADYIAETYAGKSTHFYPSFYNLIADLMGVSREVMIPFVKPPIVPALKRLLIYGRFPNAVQRKIYSNNPYTGYCTRDYYNYQLLTKEADALCVKYIEEFEITAEEVLLRNGILKDFIIEHSIKCGLPIQLDLFGNIAGL